MPSQKRKVWRFSAIAKRESQDAIESRPIECHNDTAKQVNLKWIGHDGARPCVRRLFQKGLHSGVLLWKQSAKICEKSRHYFFVFEQKNNWQKSGTYFPRGSRAYWVLPRLFLWSNSCGSTFVQKTGHHCETDDSVESSWTTCHSIPERHPSTTECHWTPSFAKFFAKSTVSKSINPGLWDISSERVQIEYENRLQCLSNQNDAQRHFGHSMLHWFVVRDVWHVLHKAHRQTSRNESCPKKSLEELATIATFVYFPELSNTQPNEDQPMRPNKSRQDQTYLWTLEENVFMCERMETKIRLNGYSKIEWLFFSIVSKWRVWNKMGQRFTKCLRVPTLKEKPKPFKDISRPS